MADSKPSSKKTTKPDKKADPAVTDTNGKVEVDKNPGGQHIMEGMRELLSADTKKEAETYASLVYERMALQQKENKSRAALKRMMERDDVSTIEIANNKKVTLVRGSSKLRLSDVDIDVPDEVA